MLKTLSHRGKKIVFSLGLFLIFLSLYFTYTQRSVFLSKYSNLSKIEFLKDDLYSRYFQAKPYEGDSASLLQKIEKDLWYMGLSAKIEKPKICQQEILFLVTTKSKDQVRFIYAYNLKGDLLKIIYLPF